MPKAPITYREAFYSKIRGTGNSGNPDRGGMLKQLEYNTVQTELGTMVEPRWISSAFAGDPSQIKQIDLTDSAFNAVRIIDDEGEFQNSFGTGGSLLVDNNA